MGLDNKSVAFDGKGTGREQRETIGTRLWEPPSTGITTMSSRSSGVGSVSGDIRAWAVSTEHGYRLEQAPLSQVWPQGRRLQR